jgi:hypothetical protein
MYLQKFKAGETPESQFWGWHIDNIQEKLRHNVE